MISSQDQNPEEGPLSFEEKQALCTDLKTLNSTQLMQIVSIMIEYRPMNEGAEAYEFDIDTTPTKYLRRIESYIKSLPAPPPT